MVIPMRGSIYTLGHSTLDAPAFVDLCCQAGIDAIADVRSVPYSRRVPHHNREPLSAYLKQSGIAYVYLGHLLGGRPGRPSLFLPSGRADYRAMRASPEFLSGIERLRSGLERFNIGLMCGEEDPITCHRCLLIAPHLKTIELIPTHIRKGGRVETQQEFEARLMTVCGVECPQGDLFDDRNAMLDRAIEQMADRHAFRTEANEDHANE
jgi:uncharacterized protein (DUF488 family)